MSFEEELVHQLTRIADSLEIISGKPVTFKDGVDLEKIKSAIFPTTPIGSTYPRNSHQDIVDEWNRELVPLGIPQINAITNNREKMVAARIKEYGKDSFHQCIEEVKQSSFLLGKTQRPWTKFNFDWLIRPNNFPKVLEGNYNDNRNSYGQSSTGYTGGSIPESWAQ